METEQGKGVTVDRSGNVVAVGQFNGTLSGIGIQSAGGADVYVIKLVGSTGAVLWARRFGGANHDAAHNVILDEEDNIYVVGEFEDAVDFGDGPLMTSSSRPDGFLLKLTTNGDFLWVKQVGGVDTQRVTSVSVAGPTVIAGGAHGGTTAVDMETATALGPSDFFVLSLRAQDGATNWLRTFGGTQFDGPSSVAVDKAGNVVVASSFQGTADFGGGPLSSQNGVDDVVLLKLTAADGNHLFSRRLGGIGQDRPAGVAVDSENNILTTGVFNDIADLGCSNTLVASVSQAGDIFLAKYSQAGACLWAKGFGGAGGQTLSDRYGRAVITNRPGEVAVTGSFCGVVSFGGPPLVSASECPNGDVFVARFSGTDGSYLNAARAGGTGNEIGNGMAHSVDGRLFVTGWFTGFAEFGEDVLISSGGEDAFVMGLSL